MLLREIGNQYSNPSDVVSNAWAKALEAKWSRRVSPNNEAEVKHIVYDKATACQVYGFSLNDVSMIGRWVFFHN